MKKNLIMIAFLLLLSWLLANCDNRMSRLNLFIRIENFYKNNNLEFSKINNYFSNKDYLISLKINFLNNSYTRMDSTEIKTFTNIESLIKSFKNEEYLKDIFKFMEKNRIKHIIGDSCFASIVFEDKLYPCSELLYECDIDTNSVMFKDKGSNILKDEAWILLLGNKWYLRSVSCF